MTVPLVPGVLTRKPKWKQLILPEIPATRFSCLTSGSLRPKLGLCILSVVLIVATCLVLVPIVNAPKMASSSASSNPEAVAAVAASNAAFAHKVYPEMVKAKGADANLIMSPFSVSTVLAMSMAGAKGDTKEQMRTALGLGQDDQANFEGYAGVIEALQSGDEFTLETANKLYVQNAYPLVEEYLESTKKFFRAQAEAVDFAQSEPVRQQINKFVEEKTHDKIKDLLAQGSIDALTRLVLINAVYFKGNWADQFNPKHTKKMPFHVTPDTPVEVDMMRKSAEFPVDFSKELDAMVLEMPYQGNRLSMFLFLSNKPEGFAKMEESFSKFDLVAANFTSKVKHDVVVPKFKLETSHDLEKPLKALGLTAMFDQEGADFSGISEAKDLSVSQVVQKAFIEVNEEGSEAAAATGMIMMTRMAVQTRQFVCNRPFLFAIRDNQTKMVLFNGRVMDPSKQ